jgi:hypothetical protein
MTAVLVIPSPPSFLVVKLYVKNFSEYIKSRKQVCFLRAVNGLDALSEAGIPA